MDATQALADLTEISSQVVQVAIAAPDGSLLATTIPDRARAERFIHGIGNLLEEAEALRQARGLGRLSQLEAATLDGSVFVVRRESRMIAATTRPDPTVGLVFYDLKHCLRSIDEPAEPESNGAESSRSTAAGAGAETQDEPASHDQAPARVDGAESVAGRVPRQPRRKADAAT